MFCISEFLISEAGAKQWPKRRISGPPNACLHGGLAQMGPYFAVAFSVLGFPDVYSKFRTPSCVCATSFGPFSGSFRLFWVILGNLVGPS